MIMNNTPRFKKYSPGTTARIDAREGDYLYILESRLPAAGKGLFTALPLYRDEVIAIFRGKILSEEAAAAAAAIGRDGCFVNLPDGTIMDSRPVFCFAKYANDAVGLGKSAWKNNARITLDEDGRVCLAASRKIAAGEEILCSYGKRY